MSVSGILIFGRRVMASDPTPSWRSFTSPWSFAAAPGMVVSLISTGLSLIGYGADLGRAVVSAALIVLLSGMLWGKEAQAHAVRPAFDSEATAAASFLWPRCGHRKALRVTSYNRRPFAVTLAPKATSNRR